MSSEVFDLAVAYGMAFTRGNFLNDANTTTALRAIQDWLDLNGLSMAWAVEDLGPVIVRCP